MLDNNTNNTPEGIALRNCDDCLNHELLVVDTNFIIYLMEYIYRYNPGIEDDEFFSKLDHYLQITCECAIDHTSCVTERLYNQELDVKNSRSTLINPIAMPKYLTDNPTDDNRDELERVLNQNIDKLSVLDEDLGKIMGVAARAFGPHRAPGIYDLSLVTLGLNISNDNDSNCILLTDDSKLIKLVKDYIIPIGNLEKPSSGEWETAKMSRIHMMTFLLKIYRCCKIDDLEALRMMSFYETFYFLDRWEDLGQDLQDIKERNIARNARNFIEYSIEKYANRGQANV